MYQGPVMMDSALSWIDITNKTTIALPYFSHLLEATKKFHKIATVFVWHLISTDLAQLYHFSNDGMKSQSSAIFFL